MRERPILFSAEMVRAILGARKTQTRRVIKLRDGSLPDEYDIPVACLCEEPCGCRVTYVMDSSRAFPRWEQLDCPYGAPGDRLWVRETWRESGAMQRADGKIPAEDPGCGEVIYAAEGGHTGPWRPSIFMPRWASRLTLEVVAVRVELVQDITPHDACAEGVHIYAADKAPDATDVAAFRDLWNRINQKRGFGWDANPFVWVVEFKPVEVLHG